MSTDKIDPSKKDATISPADDLVKPANAELSEEELKRVTGGKSSPVLMQACATGVHLKDPTITQ